ncbi:MAG: sulfite exporter TauE/SafE family protein [Cyclobacteriaceae bacterium]|nr:sulfite exporter TauE/SafE family protein [Cyclobacteriaceae bacterium]
MTEFLQWAMVIGVGFLAGFLNTIGGGGTLFSVPILTFMGMPIIESNATARVAILAQNFFAVGGFHSKGVKLPWPYALYLGLSALIGGVIGARLATYTDEHIYSHIFVIVMIFSVVMILFDPFKTKGAHEKMATRNQVIGVISFFFIGIYGGFVQAGIGFLIIAALSLANNLKLVTINYLKVFSAIVYTGASVVVFALDGKIDWSIGLILAIGHAGGGWIASRWSVSAGEVWIKRVMVVSIVAMAVKLWFF